MSYSSFYEKKLSKKLDFSCKKIYNIFIRKKGE